MTTKLVIRRLTLTICFLMAYLVVNAIDPHGARVDYYDTGYSSSSSGGLGVLIVLALIVGSFFLFATSARSKKRNNTSTTSSRPATSDWEDKIRRMEKQDHDAEVGLKWGCGIPLLFLIVYILNYYFHFIS